MSADEVESERQELLARLDPSMIEFIRKRRYKMNKTETESKTAKLIDDPSNKTYKTEHGTNVKLPLKNINKKWVNFQNVEPDKLEWMQVITASIS